MTSYHGGKQRIGKRLAKVIYDTSLYISNEEDFDIKGYCEPFCGMLGVYQHIPKLFKKNIKYKAGDINKNVILMWKKAQKGWFPDIKINKKEYDKLKHSKKESALKGFIGHHCSFGGKYFDTFRPERCKKKMIDNTIDKINDIGEELKNVSFQSGFYTQYSNLKNYVIYCDPPYSIFNKYYDDENNILNFNHKKFWDWCRKMSENNIIFISEYKAPEDFALIYLEKSSINHNTTTKNNFERLYVI